MKYLLAFSILISLLTACSNSKELSCDTIWDNYIEASLGNREELLKVKSKYEVWYITDDKLDMPFITKLKYPDKVYMESYYPHNSKLEIVVNGASGIAKTVIGTEQLPTSDVVEYGRWALIFPELYFKEQGFISLIGEEKIEGKKYYNIEVKTEYLTANYLIGKTDFVLFRIITGDSYYEIIEREEIDGIKMVKRFKSCKGEECVSGEFTNHELNIEIDDSLFELEQYQTN